MPNDIHRVNGSVYRQTAADKKQEEELWKLRKSTALMLRAQLDNVDVQQEDGTIINLGEKYGIKKRH